MTCSTSKISRLETGKGVPKVPDVSELLRIYGVDSDAERALLLRLVHDGREHGWWETYTEGVQPERHFLDSPSRYTSLENDARAVRCFDLTIVHGLLQTEDYMRARPAGVAGLTTRREIERLVALRLRAGRRRWCGGPRNRSEFVDVLDEVGALAAGGRPGVIAGAACTGCSRRTDYPT